ncbi:MAG: insulinase family protein [Candidatus Omnitrophica bacterium]|nr:insulinase family protein [Candidatus Omnitrophota bacterium]MCB9746973.1 insulinase family protein [Candidatus Omnitrophota bacterium]
MYKLTRLDNGIKVVSHEIKDRESVSLGFWIGVGGRYEEDAIKGAAHFLEHIVFKGSRKYSCEQIKEKIEGIGGNLNAFTTEEQTCYYAKIPAQHVAGTFDVLSDMVVHPKIDTKDVAKERTVIIEEIKMYHDLPQYYVLDLLDSLLWPQHPLGKGLTGTAESVSGIKNKDLKSFHQRYYSPENIIVSACGKINHDQLVRLTKRKFSGLKHFPKAAYIKAKHEQNAPNIKYAVKNIEQMHIAIGMHGYNQKQKERYILTLLSTILGGNMSSRLFVELREKRGLAYSIYSSTKSLEDTGAFFVRGGVESGKLVAALRLILTEFRKIKKNGVSVSEFKRAKDYIIGQLLLGLEDTMDHMLWLGESVMSKGKTVTLKEVVEKFRKIQISDIQRIANEVLDEKKFNLAVVGPLTAAHQTEINRLFKRANRSSAM